MTETEQAVLAIGVLALLSSRKDRKNVNPFQGQIWTKSPAGIMCNLSLNQRANAPLVAYSGSKKSLFKGSAGKALSTLSAMVPAKSEFLVNK